MKKITLILAFIGMITLQGCSNEDTDTISEVFEFTNVDFLPNDYTVVLNYPHSIPSSNMVLVYRLSGSFQGEDVWKLLPETYFFGDGTLDMRYDFDFTRYDAEVKIEGYDLVNVSTAFKLDQILRVVSIPGYQTNKTSVDLKDYKAVVKAYNIKENSIIKVK